MKIFSLLILMGTLAVGHVNAEPITNYDPGTGSIIPPPVTNSDTSNILDLLPSTDELTDQAISSLQTPMKTVSLLLIMPEERFDDGMYVIETVAYSSRHEKVTGAGKFTTKDRDGYLSVVQEIKINVRADVKHKAKLSAVLTRGQLTNNEDAINFRSQTFYGEKIIEVGQNIVQIKIKPVSTPGNYTPIK